MHTSCSYVSSANLIKLIFFFKTMRYGYNSRNSEPKTLTSPPLLGVDVQVDPPVPTFSIFLHSTGLIIEAKGRAECAAIGDIISSADKGHP